MVASTRKTDRSNEEALKTNDTSSSYSSSDSCPEENSYHTEWLKAQQVEKQIKCDVCKQIFSDKDIWSHVEIHIGATKVQQPEAGSSTDKKQILSSNRNKKQALSTLANSMVKTPFTCDICKKSFRWKHSLRRHMNIHIDKQAFKCGICHSSFSKKSALSRHLLIHSRNATKKISTSFEKPFACDICMKTFQRKASLRKHIRNVHIFYSEPFKCGSCDSVFVHKSSLNRHLLKHKDK